MAGRGGSGASATLEVLEGSERFSLVEFGRQIKAHKIVDSFLFPPTVLCRISRQLAVWNIRENAARY